mgnify:CR=1 FL=1
MLEIINSWLTDNAQWLSYEVLQNSIKDYCIAVLVCIAAFTIIKIFRFSILSRVKGFIKNTKTHLDDSLLNTFDKISDFFYGYISIYVGTKFLTTNELIGKILINILLDLQNQNIIL